MLKRPPSIAPPTVPIPGTADPIPAPSFQPAAPAAILAVCKNGLVLLVPIVAGSVYQKFPSIEVDSFDLRVKCWDISYDK
jgi:hypothetical protein